MKTQPIQVYSTDFNLTELSPRYLSQPDMDRRVTRSALLRVFNREVKRIRVSQQGSNTRFTFSSPAFVSGGQLNIGCQVFDVAATRLIRRWARKGSK